VIEIIHGACVGRRPHHIGLQRFKQSQVLLHRNRQLGRAQGVEEVNQHSE
jgi:hypothetical protein